MAVVSPETLSHGAEINESTAGLSPLAQSEAGAPYQSEYPDFWQARCEKVGAAAPRDQIWDPKESPPLRAPKYGVY